MQSKFKNRSLLILALLSAIATTGIAHAETQSQIRSCVIQENFDSNGYTYMRCRERERDIWLATMQTSVSLGESISFYDCPPMVNFKNKSLNRTFSQIFFVSGISRKGTTQADASKVAKFSERPSDESAFAATDNLYAGEDDNGTLVFTDDPYKAPRSAKVKRKTKKIANSTALANFSTTEQKLVSMLEKALNAYCSYDMRTLQSITFPAYWSKLKQDIDKEGNIKSEQFFRLFCFEEFKAESAQSFNSRCYYDNKIYPTTNIDLNGIQPDTEEEIGCTASFVKVKNIWKYVDIICGAGIGYPPGFREP